jgi:hypothetical protein
MMATIRVMGAATAAAMAFLSTIDFSSSINLGAIIVGALVLIFGGFFSIRANAASNWRTNYFAEKERAENAINDAKEQRELKHTAIAEVAALKMTRDLVPVLTELKDLRELHEWRFQTMQETSARIAANLDKQADVHDAIAHAMQRMHPNSGKEER